MKKLVLCLVLFSIFSCNEEKVYIDDYVSDTVEVERYKKMEMNNKDKIFIYEVGYGSLDPKSNETYEVADEWGIVYVPIGCMVTPLIIEYTDKANQNSKKRLVEKYGIDWQDKFQKEVEEKINNK